jgi:transposase
MAKNGILQKIFQHFARKQIDVARPVHVSLDSTSIKNPWSHDAERYKNRNEIERYFWRLKAYRRIFSHFDKLDVICLSFLYLAMFMEIVRHACN